MMLTPTSARAVEADLNRLHANKQTTLVTLWVLVLPSSERPRSSWRLYERRSSINRWPDDHLDVLVLRHTRRCDLLV